MGTVEVSRVGVERESEEGEDIELSLELSIGRGSGGGIKCGKGKQQATGLVAEEESLGDENVVVLAARSDFSSFSGLHNQQAAVFAVGEARAQDRNVNNMREVQAFRRREARKKREEKLLIRKSAGVSNCNNITNAEHYEKVMCLEAQQLQARAQNREMKEEESVWPPDDCDDIHRLTVAGGRKVKNFVACFVDNNEATKDSNFISQTPQGLGPEEAIVESGPLLLKRNGSVFYGYGTASLVPSGVVAGKEEELEEEQEMMMMKEKGLVLQPAAVAANCGGSFRPYNNNNVNANQVILEMSHNSGTGWDSGYDSNPGGVKSRIVNHNAVSNGSLDRSSSAVSDYRSTSAGKGGSISDTGSHSSCLQANDRQLSLSATSDALNQAEFYGNLNKNESGHETVRIPSLPKQMFPSAETQICKANTSGNCIPDNKLSAVSPKFKEYTSSSMKQSNQVKDNLSKIQSHNCPMQSLPQMPCVSTTGNGPNGKTISGLLYRYTKTEISIVCVCHGRSFSPAEFVEHAGGVDVTQPLRHITMVPSSFG